MPVAHGATARLTEIANQKHTLHLLIDPLSQRLDHLDKGRMPKASPAAWAHYLVA
jgi:hypothetical protein